MTELYRDHIHKITRGLAEAASLSVSAISLFYLVSLQSAHAQPNEFDCAARLQIVLHFKIDQLRGKPGQESFDPHRISAQKNSITQGAAVDYRLLTRELNEQTIGLSTEQTTSCQDLAKNLSAQLQSFFGRRLTYLLDQGDLDGFFSEYMTLLSPWVIWSDRASIGSEFSSQEKKALSLLLGELTKSLEGTSWQNYADLNPLLQSWNPEWLEILGTDAPGAVLIRERKIALQIHGMQKLEVGFFLFHELSHLDDPRIKAGESVSDFHKEQFAWRRSIDFLNLLRERGVEIPPLLLTIEAAIHASAGIYESSEDPYRGLDNWIEAVIGVRRVRSFKPI